MGEITRDKTVNSYMKELAGILRMNNVYIN